MDGRNHKPGCSVFPCFSGRRLVAACPMLFVVIAGCYAPMHSGGILARTLPDEYRWPQRTAATHLNYSSLVGQTPSVYTLGSGDRLQITVPDLIANGNVQTFEVTVLDDGEILIPRLGPVAVGGLSLAEAQQRINSALASGLLQHPCAIVSLAEKGTVNVLVLGAVKQPGIHALPRFENDVAHALAAAQGFSEDADDMIEIHRREHFRESEIPSSQSDIQMMSYQSVSSAPAVPEPIPQTGTSMQVRADQPQMLPYPSSRYGGHSLGQVMPPQPSAVVPATMQGVFNGYSSETPILRIPLRGTSCVVNPSDVVLNAADVVIVPPRKDKVFYVVGPLSVQNRVRFSLGDRDREIGNGLLLPNDREIDVVTAVAMAGYIDPIESPTTVNVQRTDENGMPMLIRVDLIAARTDPYETILVQPGDIIYLNPDPWWYYRRMVDHVIDRTLGSAFLFWLTN